MKSRSVRLPDELDSRLIAFAKMKRKTLSEVTVDALERHLDNEVMLSKIETAVRNGLREVFDAIRKKD